MLFTNRLMDRAEDIKKIIAGRGYLRTTSPRLHSASMSKPDFEMLFFFELLPEQYYTDEEKIDGATNRWMLLYCLPGLLHIRTPVNVIKN